MRWCDLTCPEASFPEQDAVDGAGSCRTFSALFCSCLGRLVPKNAPCAAREGTQGQDEESAGPR